MSDEQRAEVIRVAKTWILTPFHDNAELIGVGVDCAHLCHAAYVGAGVLADFPIPHYSPQHMLHRDEEKFLSAVLETGAREIDPNDAQPADLILYRIGRVFAHGAIVIDWPRLIIHAHKQSGCVLIMGPRECDLANRAIRAFTFW